LVFIHGLQEDEITRYKGRLFSNRGLLALPTTTATLLIDQRVRLCSQQLRKCHGEIVGSEDAVLMRTRFNSSSQPTRTENIKQKLDKIDFDTATYELTGLLTRLAYCEFISEIFTPMLQSLERINDRIQLEQKNQGQLVKAAEEIRAMHEFQRGSLAGVSHRARYLSKRAQAQVQTVRRPKMTIVSVTDAFV
jgi:hypothetical protein